jgi:1,4-dihydroxy-6-naphthoate synthase
LGQGVGPLLISKKEVSDDESDIKKQSIAIPGSNTTANLLLGFAYPGADNKKEMIFSSIEDSVLAGITDLGVIIHENRFTYEAKGLFKVKDLGQYWESKMNVPIPLGGIAISLSLKRSLALKINALLRKSLEYAFANYPTIPAYVKENSQEMDESVMRKHIDLYVNKYSLDLGTQGQEAISVLFDVFKKMHAIDDDGGAMLFL